MQTDWELTEEAVEFAMTVGNHSSLEEAEFKTVLAAGMLSQPSRGRGGGPHSRAATLDMKKNPSKQALLGKKLPKLPKSLLKVS